MNEEDKKELAETLVSVLDRNRSISYEQHSKHHEFVDTLIAKEKKRADSWDSIKMHVVKFGVLGFVTFIAISTWHYFNDLIAGVINK